MFSNVAFFPEQKMFLKILPQSPARPKECHVTNQSCQLDVSQSLEHARDCGRCLRDRGWELHVASSLPVPYQLSSPKSA